jgi:tRNA(Ile)-lysidine synthase
VELPPGEGVQPASRAAVELPPGVGPGVRLQSCELDAKALAEYPAAVRRRVLRAWLMDAGVRELTDARLRTADDLVGRWRGQGALALHGGRELARERGRLVLRSGNAHELT